MDFNLNGVIERNDAYLLARANLDMVRFVRYFHVTVPDHQNKSTNCALELTATLSTREGSMETNTQVYFEFASAKKILSSQLRSTACDTGELITTYDRLNKLFGGIVKAESQDHVFQVVAKKSQIEMSNMGLSMIQVTKDPLRQRPVVTPLFMYTHDPMFPAEVQVQMAPDSDLVLSSGHSPQLTVNITESYATCQDPPITKNVMFVFQNDYSNVQGNEDSFTQVIIIDLTARFPLAKIDKVRLAPGSILVYFDITTQRSRMENTLVALWDMLKSGYTLQANSTEYRAKKIMRVDGQDYYGNDELSKAGDDQSNFPTGAVIAVCVVVTLVVIVAVAYFCFRKRIKQRKDRFSWKSASRINIIESRSTSRMSNESGDTEMVPISGLSNDHFEYSDSETSPSPRPSSRNSSDFTKRKLRKVESASSQVSIEAWADSSSPALARRTFHFPLSSPKIDTKLKGASPIARLLTKHQSDSQLLVQENSSTEGSPLNLSPRTPKRGQSPQKRRLQAQKNLSNLNSDSSDEEFVKSGTSSSTGTHTPSRKSLTPQISGSKLKDQGSEHFVFEKAVLYKRLMPQETGSRHSCKLFERF